jgi:seryl-tRNA synthetase
MLDPKLLKESPEIVRELLKKRNIDFPLEDLLSVDKRRRELIIEIEANRQKKNILTNTIAQKKKQDCDTSEEISEIRRISDNLSKLEFEKLNTDTKFKHLIMSLPNLILDSVPIGDDKSDNVFLRSGGDIRKFDFKPKDHVDLTTALDLIDLQRGAKISGSRFYFLKNDLVWMNQALIRLALDFLHEKGYILLQPPYMIRREAMEGAVILGDFEQVIYKIEGEDLYMIGTSEHAMASMHMDEILDGKKLPIKYAAVSPCFRKEAGAHGKDMKGIFRVHQFEKVEQFIYSRPDESEKDHDNLLSTTEEFYEKLGIPFRTVLLCSGDLGKISAKTFDIEAWMPGQNTYREIVSCSNCIDYQARRLRIRFRDRPNEQTRLAHTLNSTLIATERSMVAIIENFQTSRGTVEIPTVLRRYMDDMKEICVCHSNQRV